MGVLPAYHRQGVGRRLIQAAEDHLRESGTLMLQVKTLSEAHPDPFYQRTRQFYLSIGFVPLETFPDLWGSDEPSLQLVKCLRCDVFK
jgi:GNAT superfamily N-acetyltransferase